jgi:hypothetical protein
LISLRQRSTTGIFPLTVLALFTLALVFLFFVHQVALLFAVPTGHDQSWYLFAAKRLLSGAKLYGPQIAETNPPLIVWFSLLPLLFARLIHGSATVALRLLVLIIIFGSVVWCIRILRLKVVKTNHVVLGLLACATLYVEFNVGSYDFGQREQLFVILALPYILWASTGKYRGLTIVERCALGLAAGLAICFKPHYLLLFIGLELVLAIRTRSLRRALAPEFLTVLFSCCLYVLLVLTITPLYARETIPLLIDTYWAYGPYSVLALALLNKKIALLTLLVLLSLVGLRRFLSNPETTGTVLVCGIFASIAFGIQHTNWAYHMYPCKALIQFAALYLLIDLLRPVICSLMEDSRLSRRFAFVTLGLMAIPLGAIATHPRRLIPVAFPSAYPELDQIFSQYKAPTTAYVFSTRVSPFASVFRSGLEWGSRFPALWMLPAIIQNERGRTGAPVQFKSLPRDTVARLALLQRNETTEDLNYWRPSVILVEHCDLEHFCQAVEGKNFDIISWFIQSPEFAAAWSHYQRREGPPHFDLYIRTW